MRSLHLGFLAWDEAGRYVAGGAILAAALFQLTPVKEACLRRCRDPLAARSGLEHGAHLHRARVAGPLDGGALRAGRDEHRVDGPRGRARPPASGLLPSRLMGRQGVAVVLALLGLAVAFALGQVPGLTLPDSQDAAGMTMMQ